MTLPHQPITDQKPSEASTDTKSCHTDTKYSNDQRVKNAVSTNTKIPKSDLAKSFDPHDFGKEDGIGFIGATVHIIRSTIGSGILMMPYAMKNLGCFTGTILIIFVGIIYYHNVHILVSTEYRLCKLLEIRQLSFIGVTEKTFQRAPYPISKFGTLICLLTYIYFGSPTAPATYLIVIATNIQHMADFFDVQLNITYIITAIIIPLTSFCLIRPILKILVPFSSTTNVFTFIMAGIVVVSSFINRNSNFTPRIFSELSFIPKGFSMFILAVRSTGIVLPVKNTMKKPKHFSRLGGSLNLAGLSVILIYYSFALITYINYGDDVQENILANLPKKNVLSFCVYLLYTMALSVTYILAFFICFNCIWSSQLEFILKPGPWKTVIEYGIRIGLNLIAYGLSVSVPQISLIAAMAGTLGIIIEIALPPLLELLSLINEKQKSYFVVFKDLFIVLISAMLFCMSTARCVTDLIKLYSN